MLQSHNPTWGLVAFVTEDMLPLGVPGRATSWVVLRLIREEGISAVTLRR